jgi:hypothetical protein
VLCCHIKKQSASGPYDHTIGWHGVNQSGCEHHIIGVGHEGPCVVQSHRAEPRVCGRVVVQPEENVTATQVRDALMTAAKPYKELIVYYNELVVVHRHVLGSGQGGSSGSRFRPMSA